MQIQNSVHEPCKRTNLTREGDWENIGAHWIRFRILQTGKNKGRNYALPPIIIITVTITNTPMNYTQSKNACLSKGLYVWKYIIIYIYNMHGIWYEPKLARVRELTCYMWWQQVFFRAGVLGQMEELRDDRLSKIVSWLQSWVRGYLSRKEFKKLQDQRWTYPKIVVSSVNLHNVGITLNFVLLVSRLALQVVQRNLRKYLQLRTWPWWKLWQKVKPLLNVTRVEDEIAVSIPTPIQFLMNHLGDDPKIRECTPFIICSFLIITSESGSKSVCPVAVEQV